MSAGLVRYSVSDKIAEIMLDRPPVNALSMSLIDALRAVDADFRRSVENAARALHWLRRRKIVRKASMRSSRSGRQTTGGADGGIIFRRVRGRTGIPS